MNRITKDEGQHVSHACAKRHVTRRLWSDPERKVLKEMFSDNYTSAICQQLGRTYSSVCQQADKMGLKKSEAFIKKELERQANRLRIIGVKSRYQKGREPENKGKPMPKEVYEKVNRTMFKKGHVPHNTNYDGHERISKDGYVEIRIKKGKYVLKHRHVWERKHGKIPTGFIVVFKDRKPTNITLENLELISREENMQRNTIQRFPAELKSAIRLVNKLKRTINEKQN